MKLPICVIQLKSINIICSLCVAVVTTQKHGMLANEKKKKTKMEYVV